MNETMLTPDEVAARLKVHVETVRRWIRAGDLKASKVGRLVRVDAGDMAAFASSTSAHTPRGTHTQNDSKGAASGQGEAQ